MPAERTVIQLVGSNPLPLYSAATSLGATNAVLIHSPQSVDVTRRLSVVYRRRGIRPTPVEIGDSADARACRAAITPDLGSAYLDYTGGRKVMAVHTYMAWLEAGGDPSRAFYVDNLRGQLRFDNGDSMPITTELTLLTVAILHGWRVLNAHEVNTSPTFREDIEREARAFIRNLEESLGDYREGGWWLEELVAILLYQTGLFSEKRIHVNVEVRRGPNSSMEMDVVALRGYFVYVVSCTATRNYHVCRNKAFEVVVRGRQFAGNHVRTAMVCPLGHIKLSERFRQVSDRRYDLQQTIYENWDYPHSFRAFGLDDIKAWIGVDPTTPDISSLKRWVMHAGFVPMHK